MNIIEINNLNYRYQKSSKDVLRNITLNIKRGDFVSIVGESGSGKSTLIKIIQGVLKPLEKDSIKMSYNKLAYIPQNGNLLPYLTIRDNIKLHYKIVTKKKITEEELKNSLKLASLEEIYLDSYPKDLSGGQRQRASIANALAIPNIDLLLLDEAFSALDEITKLNIQDTLMVLAHKRPDLTIISITHNINEALICSDKIVHLHDGKIMQIGTPTELVYSPSNIETNNFVNKANIDCKINEDSWRVSAIRKCQQLNKEEITVIDDNEKILGTVSLSKIKDSMNKTVRLGDLI